MSGRQPDSALAELLTLWPRLSDEIRQSLLRIARARMELDANECLDRQALRMEANAG